MTISPINLGTTANDGTGAPLRSGGQIINDNFAELDTRTAAAQATAESAGDNFIVNSQFDPKGPLNASLSPNGTTAIVDNTAVGVPANCPVNRLAVATKLIAGQLYVSGLVMRGGLGYQRVTPGETLDVSVIVACTGQPGTGNTAARLVVVESDSAGTFVANTRVLSYDNALGGWQNLSGSFTLQPTTSRIVVGMWSESAMPVGGKIYYGEPRVSRKYQPTRVSVGDSNALPLPILDSGYVTGLGAYNSITLSGYKNAHVAQGFGHSTAGFGPNFIGARSMGTIGTHGAMLTGRSCMTMMGLASDGTAYQPIARMDAFTEEATTPTASGGEWQVWTTPIGANRPTLSARFRANGDFEGYGDIKAVGTKSITSAYRMGIIRNNGIPYLTMARSDLPDGVNPAADSVILSLQGKTASADPLNFDGGRALGVFDVAYLANGGGRSRMWTRSSLNVTTAMLQQDGEAGTNTFTGTLIALDKIDARKAIDEATTVSLASAATVSVGAAASNTINVTGTTTITSLGAGTNGQRRTIKFTGILTLTHNATSLIIPGGANVVTAANDTMDVLSLGGSNWVVLNYKRASGHPLTITQSQTDVTVGRLLRVGDFGIGAYASGLPPVTNLNNTTAVGFYIFAGSATGVPTEFAGSGGSLIVTTLGGNFTQQIAQSVPGSTTQPFMMIRCADSGGVFGPWVKMFHTANIVGNVAGTQPGAIFETGSTASGTYIKMADGTLICTSAGANNNTGTVGAGGWPEVICNLPASFVGTFIGYMIAGPTISNDHYGITNCYQYNASQIAGALRNGPVAQAFALRFIAIGRWK